MKREDAVPALNKPSTSRKSFAFMGAVTYGLAYVAALWATQTDAAEGLKFGLSVTAVLAFGVFLFAELRMVRELDELEQRIQLEALAFALPLSIGFVMLLGLLQRFWTLPVEDASYRHVWPVMILFYVVGLWMARLRYR